MCSPFQGMAKGEEGYKFKTIVSQKVTPVKNQASTGTCWCFATTSFFEAELLRMGKGEYDLSEMFIVRQKYMNQLDVLNVQEDIVEESRFMKYYY